VECDFAPIGAAPSRKGAEAEVLAEAWTAPGELTLPARSGRRRAERAARSCEASAVSRQPGNRQKG
jgi:hypothetical protein